MPKPVCVKCACFYRPKKNGYCLVEGMPNGTTHPDENIRGHRKPEAWQPYKLWVADLWECPDCGHQMINGFASRPLAEHYQSNFKMRAEACRATLQVNDC